MWLHKSSKMIFVVHRESLDVMEIRIIYILYILLYLYYYIYIIIIYIIIYIIILYILLYIYYYLYILLYIYIYYYIYYYNYIYNIIVLGCFWKFMTPLLIKEYVSMIVDALPYLMCENINKT